MAEHQSGGPFDLTLSGLSIASGSTPLQLSPVFSPYVNEYTLNVSGDIDELQITMSKTEEDDDWGCNDHYLYKGQLIYTNPSGGLQYKTLQQVVGRQPSSMDYIRESPQVFTVDITPPTSMEDGYLRSGVITVGVTAGYEKENAGEYNQYTINLVHADA